MQAERRVGFQEDAFWGQSAKLHCTGNSLVLEFEESGGADL